jgi:hypothetical protein
VDHPIVEGGGFDQFQTKLVSIALGVALAAPNNYRIDEEIQFVDKLQIQEGPHEGRGAAHRDLAAGGLLELARRVGKLAFKQRRVVPINLGQGA